MIDFRSAPKPEPEPRHTRTRFFVNGNEWHAIEWLFHIIGLPLAQKAWCLVETRDGFVRVTGERWKYDLRTNEENGHVELEAVHIWGTIGPFTPEDKIDWETSKLRMRHRENAE